VLRLIAGDPDLNQRALAARLQALPSRVVALIDELEALDLVSRRRQPQDRRSHILALTPKGEDMLVELRGVAEEHESDLLAALEQSDRAALTSLLQRWRTLMGWPRGYIPGTEVTAAAERVPEVAERTGASRTGTTSRGGCRTPT
jgi:DNA-binding MarR family transcriptional regulator